MLCGTLRRRPRSRDEVVRDGLVVHKAPTVVHERCELLNQLRDTTLEKFDQIW
jgi:hypothetical protein